MNNVDPKDPKEHTTWSVIKFGVFGLLLGCIIAGFAFYMLSKEMKHDVDWQRMHVKSIESIDRNCNDCHLGLSFINLFSIPLVRANDNIVNKMLDGAKIKRW